MPNAAAHLLLSAPLSATHARRHKKGYLFPISLAVEEESIGGKTTYHGSIRSLSEIEGVLIADLQGTILNVNQGLCYLFGYR